MRDVRNAWSCRVSVRARRRWPASSGSRDEGGVDLGRQRGAERDRQEGRGGVGERQVGPLALDPLQHRPAEVVGPRSRRLGQQAAQVATAGGTGDPVGEQPGPPLLGQQPEQSRVGDAVVDAGHRPVGVAAVDDGLGEPRQHVGVAHHLERGRRAAPGDVGPGGERRGAHDLRQPERRRRGDPLAGAVSPSRTAASSGASGTSTSRWRTRVPFTCDEPAQPGGHPGGARARRAAGRASRPRPRARSWPCRRGPARAAARRRPRARDRGRARASARTLADTVAHCASSSSRAAAASARRPSGERRDGLRARHGRPRLDPVGRDVGDRRPRSSVEQAAHASLSAGQPASTLAEHAAEGRGHATPAGGEVEQRRQQRPRARAGRRRRPAAATPRRARRAPSWRPVTG